MNNWNNNSLTLPLKSIFKNVKKEKKRKRNGQLKDNWKDCQVIMKTNTFVSNVKKHVILAEIVKQYFFMTCCLLIYKISNVFPRK